MSDASDAILLALERHARLERNLANLRHARQSNPEALPEAVADVVRGDSSTDEEWPLLNQIEDELSAHVKSSRQHLARLLGGPSD